VYRYALIRQPTNTHNYIYGRLAQTSCTAMDCSFQI